MRNEIITTLIIIYTLGFGYLAKPQLLKYQNDSNLKSLGIGVLQKNKISEKTIFYLDSMFKHVYNIDKDIVPLLFKPDYGVCFFICLKSEKEYFVVKSNAEVDVYIKPTESFTFFYWEDFLCNQIVGTSNKNPSINPPRDNINGKLFHTELWNNDDEQDVIETNGDWIKIRNINQEVIYWIKWKEKNKLLVYLNMLI